jgi:predicted GNAT family acetyltransferase
LVCKNAIKPKASPKNYRLLSKKDVSEMLALTALTKPGPFLAETISMGNYYGIFENNQLVAMAGERMHLADYTEISAVCTHPAHTGKGYGTQLLSLLIEDIIQNGKSPFLHVRADNQTAISLYEKLGFEISRDMYFAVIQTSDSAI